MKKAAQKPKKPKRMSPQERLQRSKQIETTRARYGDYHYKQIGALSSTYKKDPLLAKRSSWRWHHPDRFDDQGEILPEWKDKFEEKSSVNPN